MTQFQEGFILDSIKQAFAESDYPPEKISGLIKHLYYFDVQRDLKSSFKLLPPLFHDLDEEQIEKLLLDHTGTVNLIQW